MDLVRLQEKVNQRVSDSQATPGNLLDRVMLSLGYIACKAAYIDKTGIEEMGGSKSVSADCAKAIIGLVAFAVSLKGDVVAEIEDLIGDPEAASRPRPSGEAGAQAATASPGDNGADLTEKGTTGNADPTPQGVHEGTGTKDAGKPQESPGQKEAMYERSLREAGSKAQVDSVYREIVKDKDLDGKTKFRLGQVKKEVEKKMPA